MEEGEPWMAMGDGEGRVTVAQLGGDSDIVLRPGASLADVAHEVEESGGQIISHSSGQKYFFPLYEGK